jgi:lipopolysaccharide export system permease protein
VLGALTFPKLAHRLFFRELLFLFVLCLAAFLSLLLVGKLLKLKELFLSLQLSIWDLAKLLVYLSPFFLLLLIPISSMLSMFLTFQRLSTDRELMAFRAGGVSLSQLFPMPLAFLLLCVAFNMFVSVYGISWGMENFRSTLLSLAKNQAQLLLQPGVFNQKFPGLIIYAEKVEKQSEVLRSVLVQDNTQEGSASTIVAPKGSLVTDREKGKIFFSLSNGRIYRRSEKSMNILSFSDYRIALDLSRLLGQVDIEDTEPKDMSWKELNKLQNDPSLKDQKGEEFLNTVAVEIQKRLALPVACLVLGLFAFPLGWMFEGLKRHYGVILMLVMFFAYYALFSLGLSLGETGKLAPAIAMWSPNVLFFLLAVAGIHVAVKERSLSFVQKIKLKGKKVQGHA